MERSEFAINYIMPASSPVRRDLLLPYLGDRPPRPLSPSIEEVNAVPMPTNLDASVRFDYSYKELVQLTRELTPGSSDDLKRVLRYSLVWSGLKLGDDNSAGWVVLDHGYEPMTRLTRVIVPVDTKRLSIRIAPDSWKGSFSTPFTLHKVPNGMEVLALDGDKTITIANPNLHYITESVQTLAYLKSMDNGTTALTINPLQKCPQECKFCCRAYYDMTDGRKAELVNLTPGEMARYLKIKFPYIKDWGAISEIAIVTGEFTTDEAVLKYIEGFVAEMKIVTSGQWNPLANSHQEITVSSHLLQSYDSMAIAKSLGMKHFLYTVEMVDDNREEVMHVAGKEFKSSSVNKGHGSFSGILDILQTAIGIFGAENVEPALVIGLDPINEAVRAMDKLKALGINNVSRALLNVYNINQFQLMHTSFEDAVYMMQYAKNLFKSSQNRVIQKNGAMSNRGELFS